MFSNYVYVQWENKVLMCRFSYRLMIFWFISTHPHTWDTPSRAGKVNPMSQHSRVGSLSSVVIDNHLWHQQSSVDILVQKYNFLWKGKKAIHYWPLKISVKLCYLERIPTKFSTLEAWKRGLDSRSDRNWSFSEGRHIANTFWMFITSPLEQKKPKPSEFVVYTCIKYYLLSNINQSFTVCIHSDQFLKFRFESPIIKQLIDHPILAKQRLQNVPSDMHKPEICCIQILH